MTAASMGVLAAPTLSDHRAMLAELVDALGGDIGGQPWGRLDGATFVAAYVDVGRRLVVGNCGGWFGIRPGGDGKPWVSEPLLTAHDAVTTALAGWRP